MNNQEITAEELAYGKTKRLLLPSGRQLTIREQNGEDDEILSNPVDAEDGTNFDKFIAAIVVKASWKNEGRITKEEASQLLLKDRYFIVMSSRIHSLGKEIQFTYDWGPDPSKGGKQNYSEDLTRYVWDYSKEFPEPYIIKDGKVIPNPDYDAQRIPPYPENAYDDFIFTLSTGKVIKVNLMTGLSEKYMMKLPPEQLTKLAELKAMNLSLKTPDGWEKVENFTMFSANEMREIRGYVSELDKTYIATTEIENPRNPGQILKYPIMQGSDFFYPEGI